MYVRLDMNQHTKFWSVSNILKTPMINANADVSSLARAQGGWGGTLIFSYIRRLGPFFLFQNSEFQYFFWVFRKMNIFLGYEDFLDIFWGSSQNWASLRVISMQFRVFNKVKVQNLDIFLGC